MGNILCRRDRFGVIGAAGGPFYDMIALLLRRSWARGQIFIRLFLWPGQCWLNVDRSRRAVMYSLSMDTRLLLVLFVLNIWPDQSGSMFRVLRWGNILSRMYLVPFWTDYQQRQEPYALPAQIVQRSLREPAGRHYPPRSGSSRAGSPQSERPDTKLVPADGKIYARVADGKIPQHIVLIHQRGFIFFGGFVVFEGMGICPDRAFLTIVENLEGLLVWSKLTGENLVLSQPSK